MSAFHFHANLGEGGFQGFARQAQAAAAPPGSTDKGKNWAAVGVVLLALFALLAPPQAAGRTPAGRAVDAYACAIVARWRGVSSSSLRLARASATRPSVSKSAGTE